MTDTLTTKLTRHIAAMDRANRAIETARDRLYDACDQSLSDAILGRLALAVDKADQRHDDLEARVDRDDEGNIIRFDGQRVPRAVYVRACVLA